MADNALMRSRRGAYSTEDITRGLGDTVSERGFLLPFGTYGDNRTGLAWPSIIHGPASAINRLFTNPTPYLSQSPEEKQQTIGDAFEAAGTAALGSFGASRPASSVGTFGGRLAKTADHAALQRAEKLAAEGAPREQIWSDTGWFKGVDGKWRFEIDDSGSTLPYSASGKEYEGPIRALLDHKDLMAAYPNIGAGKGWLTIADHIKEPSGLAFRNGNVIASASNTADARKTLLHELQHQVQKHENFANGSGGGFVRTTEDYARHKAHAGEQEAYAVEKRMDLTADQRRARPPWLDYDVPEDQQIVRFVGSGPQMSVPDKPTNSLMTGPAGSLSSGAARRVENMPPSYVSRGTAARYRDSALDDVFYRGVSSEDHAKSPHSYWWTSSSPATASGYAGATAAQLENGMSPAVYPSKMKFNNPLMRNPIRAYHGSPHDFDRFDLGKIGTGEGAQAYGRGLYFAENEGVAKSYRDTLATEYRLNGKPMIEDDLIDHIGKTPIYTGSNPLYIQRVLDRSKELGSLDAVRKEITEAVGNNYRGSPKAPYVRMIDELDRMGVQPEKAGKMYEVNIHASPDDFLDWDKPLSQQSEKVRGAIKKFGDPLEHKPLGDWYRGAERSIAEDLAKRDQLAGQLKAAKAEQDRLYWAFSRQANAPPVPAEVTRRVAELQDAIRPLNIKYGDATSASEVLTKAGIPGIRYLDQGSRTAGEGSRNYVVFDDALVEILRKYGLLGTLGAGAAYGAQPAEAAPTNALMRPYP